MKRGKKVLCSILSLALFCSLALPARAAEPWKALEGIAYYGDRSKCAMTEEQAKAFAERIETEMARTDWDIEETLEMRVSPVKGFAALFDLGNGVPALAFVRGYRIYFAEEPEYFGYSIDVGEVGVWTYENGTTVLFEPFQKNHQSFCITKSYIEVFNYHYGDDVWPHIERYSYGNGKISNQEDSQWKEEEALISGVSGSPISVDYTIEGLTPIGEFKPALLSYVSAAQSSTRVTLHLNGGNGGSALWTNDAGTIQVPTNPTREGYTFAGWFTDPDLTVAWNFNSAVTGDLTLYAKWVPVSSSAATVGQSTQAISFNGGVVEVQAYTLKADNGGDVTYVKLRDMAALLDGSAAQFNVDWRSGAIYVERGKPYTTRNGTELQPIAGTDGSYRWNTAPILFDGTTTAMEGIVLEGKGGSHTFLKLRDLADAVGFTVNWSKTEGITIGTK